MTVIPLTAQPTADAKGWTHMIQLDYTDLSDTAGTTKTIELLAVQAYDVIWDAGYRLTTAFNASDDDINSLLIELGIAGATAAILPQKELAVDGTEILGFVTANATNTMPYTFLAADTVDALFTVAGGETPLLSELNAGAITVYLKVGRLPA